ncbi:hypothetical protein C2845_PM02G44570 [Panicum miliaceum]|uniref:AAA-ATPase n=1 Tax=Panicum miliaceum TaxID=4540 RepID=A0A3L6SIB7_PANMI|nr:hypothetical protein C2845_PM02G44570 [Panicum miliaceum]
MSPSVMIAAVTQRHHPTGPGKVETTAPTTLLVVLGIVEVEVWRGGGGVSLLSGLNSGVVLSLIAVLWTVVWQNLQQFFGRHLSRHARRLAAMVDPYLSVTIAEYEGGRMKRSDAYEEVKAYLSAACSRGVRHLRAEGAKDADKLVLSMVDGEEVADEFEGATWSDGGYMRSAWSHVVFEHPKTFDTLAMDPAKKKEIKDDLDMFKNGKDYYARVGKAWKRGYLLYGPPGTGKSAMIAAMAMDKHIEMSYCGFEAFKFLAKTYLDVDAHALFGAIGELLREVEMTPADVAENLTPKSLEDNPDTCLAALVKALEEAKEKKASGGNDPDEQEDEEEEQ